MKVTKKACSAFIKAKIKGSDAWALRALEVVFNNQTLVEQNCLTTIEDNGIGFTGSDAEFLTSLYKQYKQYGRLSPRQLGFVHKVMPKYHNQVILSSKQIGKFEELKEMVAKNV